MDCTETGFKWPSLNAPPREGHIAMWDYLARIVRDLWPKPVPEKHVLKIEKNRYYLTRGGELAYVYYTEFINAGGTYPIGGAIRRGKNRWYLMSWEKDGHADLGYMHNECEDADDLVALVENNNWRLEKESPEYN